MNLHRVGTGRSDAAPSQAAPPTGTNALLARLGEEGDRQVPFSQLKLLLREAASTIRRLEADLATARAAPREERAAPQA